ncbi:hypothetical protein HQ35_00390 [Porphyromonas cangingivalis]|uniref:Uncharacterized protein n=1 Tax=Porphyromonas cangingivalis TaxID=36874 RepID=A0A0A2F470_PORCN|nr:hypothetical protein [Porphyromonas cangingivalis]KGN83264.1 hypothetical protein HQ35_00390 [Porphyromonas cangingivalis]
MFDFVNYTYSGMLAILATLFGLSYPLVISGIERIDTKYKSTTLSERFTNERSFKCFKRLLYLNIAAAILFPFLMDDCIHSRLFIGIQCFLLALLIVNALILYSKIIRYYNVNDLQKDLLRDFREAVEKQDDKKVVLYFKQWGDLTPVLVNSMEDHLVNSFYDVCDKMTEYIYEANMNNSGRKEWKDFEDQFYYTIYRINEALCRGVQRPFSVNNRNYILTSQIKFGINISDIAYRHLWRNLRVQIFYDRDEWIMEYWEIASQRMQKFPDIHVDTDREDSKQKYLFLEFHIMLCAMLLQHRKYRLLRLMLSFTQSEPPFYPLVPSKIRDIIGVFKRILMDDYKYPGYYEGRYPMGDMDAPSRGKIIGAAFRYLALLVYRMYIIRWSYGHRQILTPGSLPDTLAELRALKDNMETFRRWVIELNNEIDEPSLQNVLGDYAKGIKDKKAQFKGDDNRDEILEPKEIFDKMIEDIDSKMEELRSSTPLDKSIVKREINELSENMKRIMRPYGDLLTVREWSENIGEEYDLDSSVVVPFDNTAFVVSSDVSYFGMSESVGESLIQEFYHLFAASFFREHPVLDYKIPSDRLFEAIDKLQLHDTHYIISFGIYWDYHVDRVDGFSKEQEGQYSYKVVKILSLKCPSEPFSQTIYVMKYDDRPFITFRDPFEEDQLKYQLKSLEDDRYKLWASIIKLNEHPDLLEQARKDLGDSAGEHSLFAAFWRPKLTFKKNYKMISIQVKYRPIDEGECTPINSVKPFDELKN